jgi:hypothetical protein
MFCQKCGVENAANSRFCMKCGNQLASQPVEQAEASEPVSDNAINPVTPQSEAGNAGVSAPAETAQTATPPPQPPPPPPPLPPPPPAGNPGVPAPPSSPIIQDTLEVVKKFFSANPGEAVALSAKKDSHIWAILGGAYALLCSLMFVVLMRSIVVSTFGGAFGMFGMTLPLGRFFVQGIFMGAISFAAYGFGVKGLFAIAKMDISIPRALNLAAGALLPMVVGFAAATIFGFANLSIAIGLLLIMSTAASILLYLEIQQSITKPSCNPLWLFLGLTAAHLLVIFIVSLIFDVSLLGGFF